MIHALLVFKEEVLKQSAARALQAHYRDQASIEYMDSLQEAIEILESKERKYDLVVFEQRTKSLTMAKVFFPLCSGAKFLMCEQDKIDVSAIPPDFIVEQVLLFTMEVDIPKTIKKYETMGYLPPVSGIKDEYVSVRPEIMASYCPLNHNVYIKMSDGRFIRLFNKGDPITRADFDRYQKEKGVDLFYFNKIEYQEVLEETANKLDAISETIPLPEELVIDEAEKSHEVVRDIVRQVGFTPEAQKIARSSVAMTAKLINSKPKLSKILTDLKKQGGTYVGAHSISVGILACSIAHKMEWHSAATFFKLSLSAFMHDITISDKLAEMNTLDDAAKAGFTSDEINKMKLHPVHAADYVRKMSEIPADVDQIVFQHHERPDGSGFPRNLSSHFISPLSSVFIVAHDLLDFIRKRPGETLEVFLNENKELYNHGNFRKIWLALHSDH